MVNQEKNIKWIVDSGWKESSKNEYVQNVNKNSETWS